jgi:hypothetical protein
VSRKLIVFLGNFYPECAAFCAELQNSSEYDFLPFVAGGVLAEQPWTKNLPNIFRSRVLGRTPGPEIVRMVRDLNPYAVLVRAWTGWAGLALPEAIYWKIETLQREVPGQQLPLIPPPRKFRAILVQNHLEQDAYRQYGVPVGWLPRGVSHYLEVPLPKTYDVMVSGTACHRFKNESFAILASTLPKVLSPEQLRIYIPHGSLNWVGKYLRPVYPAENGPTLMAQAKIFISPVTTRYDPGIISHKTIQAMACRTLTLTQRYDGVEDLMGKDGENLIYASTSGEAQEKVLYYLAHDAAREMIAQRGYEFVHNKYNVTRIIQQALAAIGIE